MKNADLAAGAAVILVYEVLVVLVTKGILTNQEAASVAVKAADQMRTGTEDDATRRHGGSQAANACERIAGWLLEYPKPDLDGAFS